MRTTINRRSPRVLPALLVATAATVIAVVFGGAATPAAQGKPATGAAATPPKKNPLLKLAQPWPSDEQMRQQKADAENRPLFASTDTVAFTLSADFKTINKDRDPASTKKYPAELKSTDSSGAPSTVPVQLSARGHVRRMARTCDYVPLKLEFTKGQVKGTLFDGQSSLKLVVQCAGTGEYEQYVMREYLAYKVFNQMTAKSVRARLAKVTYVDSATGKPMGTRAGIFLEDDGDVAKRMGGRTVDLPRVQFKDVDSDTLNAMMLFEYMVGNTDFSLYALHNVVFVQTPDRRMYTVPYDLDMSGLVHPPYAIPGRGLPIKTVQDRLYRGPCMAPDQAEPFATFNAKQPAVMGLLNTIPGMDKASREDAKSYLESFYSSTKDPKEVRRIFVTNCSKAPTM